MTITDPSIAQNRRGRLRRGCMIALVGGPIVLVIIVLSGLWLNNRLAQPHEAPEAEMVLSSQANLPFQVLIPAFLPRAFDRSKVSIQTGLVSPDGEALIRLSYPTRQGYTLELSEWLPKNQASDQESKVSSPDIQPRVLKCHCLCRSRTQCDLSEIDIRVGQLRINLSASAPGLISMQEIQTILSTLGPAANRLVYTSLQDVPLSYSLPPAIEVPINSQGVQELTLVVTPQGYTPVHFSVKRDIPVRLIFRQYGQVGCGNELIFTWGDGMSTDVTLASADDVRIIDFTPDQMGDFLFHCPHQIYRGAMTVIN